MTQRRTVVIVVAALVAGAVAAGLSYWYLHSAQNRAYHNATLVPAYVVERPVPKGLSGEEAASGGYLARESIPVEVRPATAITDLTALHGLEAATAYTPGQVLVDGMFVSTSLASGSFAQQIPAGDVAVTVSVDQVHGVANLVAPGDKVDIMVQINGQENLFMQNVQVLAIGQTSASEASRASTTATVASGLFTFATTPADALKIALAEQQSLGIYLSLVPPGNPVVPVAPISPANVG
jgi:pilus assembly protein CpaB